ncbi:4a-hydroxytetrahydrobiopterin dehydratase [Jiangella aurantiaca]|uniref:Putative pterin-4-alpha-carbinolamine dehydratase n=1 Tax=Jiangella aurantiaca TaxID=2530373 RepID=A0A4R5AB78_9ACTN|nr:VOC family protein [Jiangella aurantiaca]TDD67012.1 4a-hydroxytetrahydrobiopterin dehydratase [Jiangella aurantiaca]
MRILTGREVAAEGLDGWAHLGNGLYTRVATPDFAAGLALVTAVGAAVVHADVERTGLQPDLSLHTTQVDIALGGRGLPGVTDQDVALVRTITGLVTDAGLRPDASVARINLALDTPATDGVLPFWRAFLAYEDRPGRPILRDPAGRLPSLWFQPSGAEEPRQRWHLDVWLDPAQVEGRIAACLAAGGRVVDDTHAPSFWVLADADGNRSCLATWQGRD